MSGPLLAPNGGVSATLEKRDLAYLVEMWSGSEEGSYPKTFVSLNSRLASNKEEEERPGGSGGESELIDCDDP